MDNLRGIAWMILAMAGFAIEDAFIKQAATTLPTGQILLMIGAGGGVFFALVCRVRGIPLWSPVLLHPAVMTRNAAEIVGTLGFVTAITTIPLATASAILQASPLVITMGAALFFGEKVGWRRWSAIGFGFAGVLLIVRPGLADFDPYALFAVLGVAGLAGRDIAARAVPKAVGNLQLAAYGFLMLVPTGAILIAASGGAVRPDAGSWILVGCATVMGIGAYYAITTAARTGEVGVVTPFRYIRLPFALLIGFVIFREVPDALTWAGAAMIIASGLYTLLRERRLARMRARSAADGAATI